MTHFMNAMAPLHHRAPGPIAWGLSREDVTFDRDCRRRPSRSFHASLVDEDKGSARYQFDQRCDSGSRKGDGDYQIWGETITVKNGRTANAAGSIAGSVISMLDAVRFMHSLGVSYVDLAQMASSNPARLLGVDEGLWIDRGRETRRPRGSGSEWKRQTNAHWRPFHCLKP